MHSTSISEFAKNDPPFFDAPIPPPSMLLLLLFLVLLFWWSLLLLSPLIFRALHNVDPTPPPPLLKDCDRFDWFSLSFKESNADLTLPNACTISSPAICLCSSPVAS